MKYKLKTEFTFDAAHRLEGYEGKCKNLHGHLWRIVVFVSGEDIKKDKDERGLVWDFTNTKKMKEYFDHKYLNSIMHDNPTAENIAQFIAESFKKDSLHLNFTIRVYESPKSYVEVEI